MLDARLTEQRNPRSAGIDALDARALVALIQAEDRTIAEAVAAEAGAIARAVELVTETFRDGGRLFYVGAGTSGRLGVLDAAEMPPTYGTDPSLVQGILAGGHVALVRAQEGAEDSSEGGARDVDTHGVRSGDFVLGIAASGTTPYVHGALARARALGARTGFLSFTPPPPGVHETHDVVITPRTGAEVVTGSTRMKAGTATKLVLNTITTGAMIQLGKTWGNLMVDLQVTCQKLEDRSLRMLRSILGIDPNEAATLLEQSGGRVKTALVMHRLGLPREDAEARLNEVGGQIGRLLGPAPK
jgi:N-acetylmuramic acid 6-phosphate etherase